MLTEQDLKRPSLKVDRGCQPITQDEFYAMVTRHITKGERVQRICHFERAAKVVTKARTR